MQRYAGVITKAVIRSDRYCHGKHPEVSSRKRPRRATYRDRVAISRDVARVNFARFVERALTAARRRGLNDTKIQEITGIGPSTFHRWRRGDWGTKGWPELQKVIDFCEGLGVSTDDAFAALGLTGQRQPTAPAQPPLDPDVRIIMRRLEDPTVSRAEKLSIRATLKYLAELAEQQQRRDEEGEQAAS